MVLRAIRDCLEFRDETALRVFPDPKAMLGLPGFPDCLVKKGPLEHQDFLEKR